MDGQTLTVLVLVAVAALYVGCTLWPARETHRGCSSCPRSPIRMDDYV